MKIIKQKLTEYLQAKNRVKKPLQKIEISNVYVNVNQKTLSLDEVTVQTFEIYIEGQKKPIQSTIQHTFCPWCGKKEIKDEAA